MRGRDGRKRRSAGIVSEQNDGAGKQSAIEEFIALAFSKSWEPDLSEPHCCEEGERKLAYGILGIALSENLRPNSVQILKQVYDSLVSADPVWRLTISRAKRGKPISRESLELQRLSDLSISALVDSATRRMGKREAAVAAVCEAFDMRRDEVFASQKRARAVRKSRLK